MTSAAALEEWWTNAVSACLIFIDMRHYLGYMSLARSRRAFLETILKWSESDARGRGS